MYSVYESSKPGMAGNDLVAMEHATILLFKHTRLVWLFRIGRRLDHANVFERAKPTKHVVKHMVKRMVTSPHRQGG